MSIGTTTFRSTISYFKTMLNPDRYYFRKNFDLALSCEGRGDRAGAIKHYLECMRFGQSQEVHKNIGMLYFEINDYTCAMTYLERTAFDSEVGFILGLCYLHVDLVHKSEQILEKLGTPKSSHYKMLAERVLEFKTRKNLNGCDRAPVKNPGVSGLYRFYDVLELAGGSPQKEIKEAYIKLVKKWHPDRFYGDPSLASRAEEKMKVINEAYDKLCRC
jgi:DnaJ-domain-containing protein 1